MAYEIRYDSVKAPATITKTPRGWVAAVGIVLLIVGAMYLKSNWLPWVQDVLLPGDPAVTAAALDEMVEGLKRRQGVMDAVTAFCREILAHAQ